MADHEGLAAVELLKYYLPHPLRLIRLLYCDYLQIPLCYYLQNKEFRKIDHRAENLIAFIVPGKNRPIGGVMSIFSLATAAKEIKDIHNSEVVLVTYPGVRTFFKNRYFKSKETVFRFNQIKKFRNVTKIIIHIPEFLLDKFYDNLPVDDKEYFSRINHVHINILNQNIECMPSKEVITSLKKFATKITQSTAHCRYSNQEICNQYKIPLHHFSVYLDLSVYSGGNFEDTRKIIVLSSDKRGRRDTVIRMLKNRLPDYKLVTVRGMTFDEYMVLVKRSKFSLTFGEGFDGYLIHAAAIGRLCFAVYNDIFFPDQSFIELDNIYVSDDDLLENIVNDIRKLESDKNEYMKIVNQNMQKINSFYSYDKFLDNQKRFYLNHYDYYPESDKAG